MDITIKKRNGQTEKFDAEKVNKVVEWATKNVSGISSNDILMNANINFYDGISSKEIHDSLIKSSEDLISLEHPNYTIVTARLLTYGLRKEVWGGNRPPRLIDHIKNCVSIGVYTDELLTKYTEDEINKIDKWIDHSLDETMFDFAGMNHMLKTALVQDRVNKKVYETPQFAFICIGMVHFADYESKRKLHFVKEFYEAVSHRKLNIPTPMLTRWRTKAKSGASCCLIQIDDTSNSIFSSAHLMANATSYGYGIGLDFSRIRGMGSPVKNGETVHSGVIPYLKVFQDSIKSQQQGGARRGAGTASAPIFHWEIENILQLKNVGGTEHSRVRHLDYCIAISKLFYERWNNDENITLFSYHEVPEVYDSFGMPEFDDLYIKAENNPNIKFKKSISANDLFDSLIKERVETNRIYILNIDLANEFSPWMDRVAMTNLCVAPETTILTKNGHEIISDLENETVEIWNGKQWSATTVIKTGTNQKLVKVKLSDGKELECTPYHKWYTLNSYYDSRHKRYTEKRTHELKTGDKLIKFECPVIDGTEEFKYPYTHGALCGDGTREPSGSYRISLYGEKRELINYMDYSVNRGEDSGGRVNIVLHRDISPKFLVPHNSSVDTKLKWLAGYCDMDGTVAKNGDNESIQLSSINHDFLKEIQLLLQTVGVNSKIVDGRDEGEYLLPDGRGGYKLFNCKQIKRLLITSNGVYTLLELGFAPKRLKLSSNTPQREAAQFVTVLDVMDINRYDDTYCVNEPLEHKAVFNGILTGNCVEVLTPTIPCQTLDDPNGEIGTCLLAATNMANIKTDEEHRKVCHLAVRMLDDMIERQVYFAPAAEKFTKNKRSLGIGITNLAGWLATKGLNHDSEESPNTIDEFMEKQQYYLMEASWLLAKEKGKAPDWNRSKYAHGYSKLDLYKKDIDEVVTRKPTMNWKELMENIWKDGMRNMTLSCAMPCEKSSLMQNSTNGFEPIIQLFQFKDDRQGSAAWIAPNVKKFGKYYKSAYDCSNENIIKCTAAIMKWLCMSASATHYYNYGNYEDNKLESTDVAYDILLAYKYGHKTLYYAKNKQVVNKDTSLDEKVEEIEAVEESACSGGACSL